MKLKALYYVLQLCLRPQQHGWWEVEGIGGRTDLREKLVSGT